MPQQALPGSPRRILPVGQHRRANAKLGAPSEDEAKNEMIEYNPARGPVPIYQHQKEDVLKVLTNPAFGLLHEMGSGKSRIVVDAADALYEAGEIDCVLVIAPASVRSVWLNEEYGEIKKHSWVPTVVCEYHANSRIVWATGKKGLTWLITNYEYVRPSGERTHRADNLVSLMQQYKNVMMVLDESSAVKSSRSKQYKAVRDLRKLCVRCVILNGTPVPNNPLDLWAQLDVLDHRILGRHYKNFFHFKYSHCNLGGWQNRQIIGWRDIDKVQQIIAPYVVRRLKKDCLSLPPKIGGIEASTPIIREVALRPETWATYRRLRTEAILALPNTEERLETNAAVRLMRLAQLTSGHITVHGENPNLDSPQAELFVSPKIEDVSSEKLDWTVDYLLEWSSAEASIVWCRWRRERERIVEMLKKAGVATYQLYGGQSRDDREAAKKAFNPLTRGSGRRVLVAQPHAGGKGLDLCAATEALYQSNDHSLEYRQQSEDRNHRSGTIQPITYLEVLATGPAGQRSIDHTILKSLRAKQDLAAWTCAAWRRALVEEESE